MGQGKEAVTVRQAILVIVLIASSFLGGAFVNGPGLKWAQTRLLRSLGLNEENEIASVDLMAAADPPGAGTSVNAAKPASEPLVEPLAPAPSVVSENEAQQNISSDPRASAQAKHSEKSHDVRSSKSDLPSLAPSTPPRPVPAPAESGSPPPMSPDSEVMPVGTSEGRPSPADLKVEPALLDSLRTLLPQGSPSQTDSASNSTLPSTARGSKSSRDVSDDWSLLQQKLQSLNVSRFTIEGEPTGRVLFSCLIPMAGRQAVTQRFEADGDDVVQAVQATVRRIMLWRATQPQPH